MLDEATVGGTMRAIEEAIARRQMSVSNDEKVIAMTEEDEASCKRFYK